MTEIRDYWITGFCPYCDRALSIFRDSCEFKIFYQCPECSRGLTILSTPMMGALIEPGMPKQNRGDIIPMPNNLWGINT